MAAHTTGALASSGTIHAGAGRLYSVGFSAGSTAGTIIVQSGGTVGGTICRLSAAAGVAVQRKFGEDGVLYSNPLVGTITGTGGIGDFEFDW